LELNMNGLLGHRPQIDGGLLAPVTANRNLLAQGVNSRNKQPIQMKPMTLQTGLDGAAMATSPIPILGDLIGISADAYRFATDPSSRTPANFGLAALGALPMVPPAMAIFAGPLAKTAKLDAKELAEGMERAGRSRDDIWKETGWFKGPEGKWRFEIDDSGAKLSNRWAESEPGSYGEITAISRGRNLGEAVKHGDLFNAYPDVGNLNYSGSYKYQNSLNKASGGGKFDEMMRQIDIDGQGPSKESARDQVKSSTLHETQHAIQSKEGFARGGNPYQFQKEINAKLDALRREAGMMSRGEVPYDETKMQMLMKAQDEVERVDSTTLYRRLAGEAEARAVQSRMNMTPAQRQATPPWQSYDVPWGQLIIK